MSYRLKRRYEENKYFSFQRDDFHKKICNRGNDCFHFMRNDCNYLHLNSNNYCSKIDCSCFYSKNKYIKYTDFMIPPLETKPTLLVETNIESKSNKRARIDLMTPTNKSTPLSVTICNNYYYNHSCKCSAEEKAYLHMKRDRPRDVTKKVIACFDFLTRRECKNKECHFVHLIKD